MYISQCVRSEDDVADCRRLCRKWIRNQTDYFKLKENRKKFEDIPFGSRCYHMALAERFMGTPDNLMDASEQDNIIPISLGTASKFDNREAALWLRELLENMYTKVCRPELPRKS